LSLVAVSYLILRPVTDAPRDWARSPVQNRRDEARQHL
jgi:hypothetical protein